MRSGCGTLTQALCRPDSTEDGYDPNLYELGLKPKCYINDSNTEEPCKHPFAYTGHICFRSE